MVDNNSSDQTGSVVKRLRHASPQFNLVYATQKIQGISPARNLGAQFARGEYLAFLDDDAVADLHWLESAAHVTRQTSYKLFGGPIFPQFEPEPPKWFKAEYEIRSWGDDARVLEDQQYLFGGNLFVRRLNFIQMGGFDVNLGVSGKVRQFGEEVELQRQLLKQSIRPYYDPRLVVKDHLVSHAKTNLAYIFVHHLRQGRDRTKMSKLKPHKHLTMFLLSLFVMVWKLVVANGLRNRRKYPYWQNYAWERVAPWMFWWGRIGVRL